MDTQTLCWLAGLLEGEAYFGVAHYQQSKYPYLALTMTDEDVVARVSNLFEHTYTPVKPQNPDWNTTYKFTLKGTSAASLMKQLYSLMSSRRQEQITHALNNYIEPTPGNAGFYKVTEEQVREIKKRLATGEFSRSITNDYPISLYAVRDIRSGKTWSHVQIDEETEPQNDSPPVQSSLALDSDDKKLYWTAGLMEAEGSFMKGAPSAPNRPRISVAMTDEDVIARLAGILGVKIQALRSRNPNHKNVFRVYVKRKKAVDFMKRIYPFMGMRRQQQITRVFDNYIENPSGRALTNRHAKLNEQQAREIKIRLHNGDDIQAIADYYDVSLSIVREIKYDRTWKHVTL